ncbi:hypothetical protein ACRAWF_28270 [Streptomyces sp. L7]
MPSPPRRIDRSSSSDGYQTVGSAAGSVGALCGQGASSACPPRREHPRHGRGAHGHPGPSPPTHPRAAHDRARHEVRHGRLGHRPQLAESVDQLGLVRELVELVTALLRHAHHSARR